MAAGLSGAEALFFLQWPEVHCSLRLSEASFVVSHSWAEKLRMNGAPFPGGLRAFSMISSDRA
jgi:hypothetical protein